MRHTKNSHNSTLFHTLLHYVIHHTPSSGAIMQANPHTPISKSHFFAFTDPLYIQLSTITSLELAQRLTAQLLTHSIHIRIHVHSLLYSAAGPIANLLHTVKYSMDHKLISLTASIILAIIWYVIYI